jgi:clan AA aspartic protease (TIGR02281 family)
MPRPAALLLAAILVVAPAAGERPPSEVPLHGDGTRWTVQATIDGTTRGHFLVDTGASYCVVARAVARDLALAPTGRSVTLHTANGAVRAPVVRLRTLDVGTTRAVDVDAIVHDAVGPEIDGVIGLNFLNRFRYAIDPQRRTLHLQ